MQCKTISKKRHLISSEKGRKMSRINQQMGLLHARFVKYLYALGTFLQYACVDGVSNKLLIVDSILGQLVCYSLKKKYNSWVFLIKTPSAPLQSHLDSVWCSERRRLD